jgi:phosphate-selective porin OprO/OprP
MPTRARSWCGGWGAAGVALVIAFAARPARVAGADPVPLPAVPGQPPGGVVPPAVVPSVLPQTGPGEAVPAPTGLATPAPAPTPAPTGAASVPLRDYWKSGLRFESADKDFSLFVGGRAQFDVVGYMAPQGLRDNVPGTAPLEDGVSFRRLRLDMGGTLYKTIDFYTQVDFANGFLGTPDGSRLTNATYPTDVWVAFKELPLVGNVKVGNQKPLYSFEHLTSSRFLNFLERSLGFDAFAEGFNNGFEPGISAYDTYQDKRGTWAVGLFKSTRSPFGWNVGRNEAEVSGRVTYLPVYEDDGEFLVHVGLGAAHRDLDQDQARFRARLDARNSPSTFSPLVADTGLIYGSRQQILVPELVAVCGPWSFQSEYYASWVEGVSTTTAANLPLAPQGTVYMQSVYAEAHYFLTGETREYNRDTGVFGRVVPRSPLAWSRAGFTGFGAWQATARYSYLDLDSKGVTGGRVHDMTLGLNWFLNPNMKFQLNYFLAHRDVANPAGDGFINGLGVRTAIDF